MKADLVVALRGPSTGSERHGFDASSLRAVQAAGILRVLNSNKPRRDQPYQTMQLAQFNYFLDRGLLGADGEARLEIRYPRYAEVVKALLEQVIALQEGGDPPPRTLSSPAGPSGARRFTRRSPSGCVTPKATRATGWCAMRRWGSRS